MNDEEFEETYPWRSLWRGGPPIGWCGMRGDGRLRIARASVHKGGGRAAEAQREERARFDDSYLALKALAQYSGLSVRTLRSYLVDGATPLPHYRVGGKILVRRSEYDAWTQQFRRVEPAMVNELAAELLRGL